jgi:AcrR family transcriptional regulator
MPAIVHANDDSRAAATRVALIDAAEALVSDDGFRTPSHRSIAKRAGTNAGLVNYHFGSKEMLFEAAIERRAERLAEAWRNALSAARCHPHCTAEAVLRAWWAPFGALDFAADPPWGNYLCVIARLASASEGETWYLRYFGSIDAAFREALKDALPAAAADDVDAGYRYARTLFGEVLLYRCGKTGGSTRPRGFREEDVERVVTYAASGLQGLARPLSIAAD